MQERGAAPALSDGGRRPAGALRRLALAGAVAAVVVAADQLTKTGAVHRLARGPVHVVWKLDFELAFNSGGSFSIAQGWAPALAVVAGILVVVLLVLIRRARSPALAAAFGLVLGGALGNLSDRLFRSHHGAVVDFIALHFWPTFNVADSCVVVGTILVAALLFRGAASSEPSP